LLCNNKYLTYVNLSGCLGLTNACLQPLIVSCKVSSMHILSWSYETFIRVYV